MTFRVKIKPEFAALRASLGTADQDLSADLPVLTESQMRRIERNNIRTALKQTEGRIYGQGGAAKLLGIPPTTLASRMKKFGL